MIGRVTLEDSFGFRLDTYEWLKEVVEEVVLCHCRMYYCADDFLSQAMYYYRDEINVTGSLLASLGMSDGFSAALEQAARDVALDAIRTGDRDTTVGAWAHELQSHAWPGVPVPQ